MRSVFVNPERCIGCRQCEIACAIEHSIGKDITAFLESPVPRKRVHVQPGAATTTEGADDVLLSEQGDAKRSVYLSKGRIIGAQLAGDIAAAGVYRSLMLKRADVRIYGPGLAAPSFGYAAIVSDAMSAPMC